MIGRLASGAQLASGPGGFYYVAPAALQAGVPLSRQNISTAAGFVNIVAYKPGKVQYLEINFRSAITAGQIDIEIFKNTVEQTQISFTSASATSGTYEPPVAVNLVAGDTIQIRYSSDAAFSMTTAGVLVTPYIVYF